MKTVLLDRDGTVILDPPDKRVDRIDKIQLFPDTIEALRYLAIHGFNAIFITNQRGIAEGRITTEQFEVINAKVMELLAPSGIEVIKTYMSPYGANDHNDWQKPGAGMLLQAAQDFGLDLAQTFMVGDRETDIQAGERAGSKTLLVQTGVDPVTVDSADYTAPNLLDAVKYIVVNSAT